MGKMPEWIREWITKDRLVHNKYKISRTYLRNSKRIQKVSTRTDESGNWITFEYHVFSDKYGRYRVTYDSGTYHCNCPFFKHRKICSHILGVCQRTNIWPVKETVLP